MADFNAGSIEGTLDLDASPFRRGLDTAKMQAKKFADEHIKPALGLDTGKFTAEKDKAGLELDKLGAKKAKPEVELKGTAGVIAHLGLINAAINKIGGKGMTGMVSHLALMAGGLLSLAAAAGPATAALVAFGGAAGLALGGAGIAMGLFAASVKSAMDPILKANKAGTQLAGMAGKVQKSFAALTGAWKSLQASVQPQMFQFLNTAFSGLAGVLPKLAPLLKTVTEGMTGVVKQVLALTHTQLFTQFLAQLTQFMHGFLAGAGPVLSNLLATFMHLFIALQPLMSMLGEGILKASKAINQFAAGLQHGGIDQFMSRMQAFLPLLGHLVTDIVHGLGNLGKGLAPLSGPAVMAIDAIVKAIGGLNIAPLAKGLGDVLKAITPLLPVAKDLINVVLQPLGQLLTDIAHGPMAVLTKSLGTELAPALSALKAILGSLVQPLSDFLASIANLVNPTGVSLATKLLQALVGPIQTLAPAVGKLLVALESVVDDGLDAIIPLIPKLTPLLQGAADAAAVFASGLAAILSHKSVVDTVLALVAAYKAYLGVMFVVTAAQKAMGLGMLLLSNTMKIVTTVTKVWNGVMRILDATLLANPIGIVIAVLVALAAAIVIAYKKSQTFRDIVQAAWHGITAAATWAWNNVLQPVLHGLVDAFGHVMVAIGTVLQGMRHFVPGAGAAGDAMVSAGHAAEGLASHISKITGQANTAIGPVRALAAAINALHDKTVTIRTVQYASTTSKYAGMAAAGGPALASGGITTGIVHGVTIGDNPTGREAVVPLDKYDIPKKGMIDALAHTMAETQRLLTDRQHGQGGSGPMSVRVFIGDTELKSMVRTEVDGTFAPLARRVRQGSV